MRTAAIDSPRGKFSFNVNHSPIQDYYKREVIAGPDGKPQIVVRGKVASMAKDSHYQKCKMKW
jgi:branched-chain amino acid transport system substrate-binding protein